jgi:hypothetical protein
VNAGKSISRQHQNLTGFSVDNAENGCMNPVPYMGCFVIHVKGMRREGEMPQMQSSLCFALVIAFL